MFFRCVSDSPDPNAPRDHVAFANPQFFLNGGQDGRLVLDIV